MRASRNIHKTLIQSILGTTLRFVALLNFINRYRAQTSKDGLIQPQFHGSSPAVLKIYRQVTFRSPTSHWEATNACGSMTVDGQIPRDLNTLLDLTLNVLTKFGAVVLFTPAFAFPGIAVALAGVWYGQMYMKAQLCVKREMSNARSPVLSHFGAAIAGIVSIRAYRAQDAFRKEVSSECQINNLGLSSL